MGKEYVEYKYFPIEGWYKDLKPSGLVASVEECMAFCCSHPTGICNAAAYYFKSACGSAAKGVILLLLLSHSCEFSLHCKPGFQNCWPKQLYSSLCLPVDVQDASSNDVMLLMMFQVEEHERATAQGHCADVNAALESLGITAGKGSDRIGSSSAAEL